MSSFSYDLLAEADQNILTPFAGLQITGPQLNGPNITITAKCDEGDPADPDMLLGSDPREKIRFEIQRQFLVDGWESQTEITVDGVRAKITKRFDNPSNPWVKFEAIKIVQGKDT